MFSENRMGAPTLGAWRPATVCSARVETRPVRLAISLREMTCPAVRREAPRLALARRERFRVPGHRSAEREGGLLGPLPRFARKPCPAIRPPHVLSDQALSSDCRILHVHLI